MKTPVQVASNFSYKPRKSVRRFLRLSECLLGPHRAVAAVRDVFFVRFAAVVFIDMAAMEELSGKFNVLRLDAFQNIDVEGRSEFVGDGFQIVETHSLEKALAGRVRGIRWTSCRAYWPANESNAATASLAQSS